MEQMKNFKKRKFQKIILKTLLVFVCIMIAFPFLWMITNSLKTKDEIWALIPKLFPAEPQWRNYVDAMTDGTLLRYICNSFYTSAIITAVTLLNSSMFAYAVTNIWFRGRRMVLAVVLLTYIMPAAVTNIPDFIILSRLGLMNSHIGYMISCFASAFNIFYFRQTFLQINPALIEAAKIDGASHWKIFRGLVVPMSIPSFVTVGILTFVQSYNSYVWPSLILKDQSKYLVSMGIKAFFVSEGAYGMKWGVIMAACCIIILPLLVLFFVGERWIIKGVISDVGAKG